MVSIPTRSQMRSLVIDGYLPATLVTLSPEKSLEFPRPKPAFTLEFFAGSWLHL